MEILRKWNRFIEENKLNALREVALFIIITLLIHYSYRYWARNMQFWPVETVMVETRSRLADVMYVQVSWFLEDVAGVEFTRDDAHNTLYYPNDGFMGVNKSCSGFKQMVQLILLFLIYPGPWRKKLWYIPLGVLAVFLVNFTRIAGLGIIVAYRPEYFHIGHDYVFRAMFYAVIFMMWVIWVEKIYPNRMKPKTRPGD